MTKDEWEKAQETTKERFIQNEKAQYRAYGDSFNSDILPDISMSSNPFKEQIGGDHYKKLAIQPVDYIIANKLDWCEANVVKYITRWRGKGGLKDLEKAIHYIELLIEKEGLNKTNGS